MRLGESLCRARKACGLSQEEVAEKLGVSRQTISKWETDETLPDIRQAKRLSTLYHVTLDELVSFDIEVRAIQEMVRQTSEETQKKIDWTKLWSEKYPILASYQSEVSIEDYTSPLQALLDRLKQDYGYGDEDAFLVLKDILGKLWTQRQE